MKVLLDECLPWRLRHRLASHDVHIARWAGLGGLANGKLLKAADALGYEVLLTSEACGSR
jgi:predicted nuclease of predicted toxin-antitoxin system